MEKSNLAPLPRRTFTTGQRRRLVERYRNGHLTQAQFARKHGLKLGTFHQWLYRANKPMGPAPGLFQELRLPVASVASAAGPWSAEIALGTDITVRLGSCATPKFITQLVKHLRRPC